MENINQLPDTLLIIDDNEINRVILREIFSQGYKIKEASNGAEGWKQLEEHQDRVCAILLDVMMPVMDGLEFLRLMKEKEQMKHYPVFLITASESMSVLQEAYELGVMDVISKPVIPYIIRRRVDSVIELFRARRKLKDKVEKQSSEILLQAQRILELNKGLIEALSTAIEFRSGESGEHVRRIQDITMLMLTHTEMGDGFAGKEMEQIALAAVMHDVGKIAVPDQILNKPGKLTREEFEIMKTHTVRGAEMLSQIPQMRNHEAYEYAYDIARHHHERWDGNGYPDGLKGDEIPISAQIVSIADVYDALVSKRVYKDALTFDKAVDMIKSGACGVFNPQLLKAFLSIEGKCRKFYQNRKTECV